MRKTQKSYWKRRKNSGLSEGDFQMTEKQFFKRSYYLITIGMFFLINPLYNVVDILPDLFGYILFYFGITELAFLDGRMESARKKLQYLMIISAFKLILTYPVVSSSLSSDRLLATFCFAIVEILVLIFFCIDFFEGFSYLAERNEGNQTVLTIANAKFLSIIFFTLKIVLSVVPELYALAETKLQVEVTYYEVYERFIATKPYAVAFSILVVLFAGIFWYINIVKMMRTAKKETEFTVKLQERYKAEYIDFPEKQNLRTLKAALYTALFSGLFFLDITVDNIRIFPETAAIIFIFIAALMLKKLGSFKRTLRLFPYVLIMQIATELFRTFYSNTNAVILDQLELNNVIINTAVVLVNASFTIWFMSEFVAELRILYTGSTRQEAPTFDLVKTVFLLVVLVHSLQIILPSLYEETATLHLLLVASFIFFCGRCFYFMIDDYEKSINR